ncbi:MAG: type II toxin-antitoxin system VapC family toxin [Chloroflexi bacterium]|nr:MAG: type II toxin-antitoxin system VapC family toxin [Chloroflexota bacterium]
MKALLDTHTFLWWNLNAPQLSQTAREMIADGDNEIFLSAASAWEIAIKYAKGRLDLPEPPDRYVPNRLKLHHFSSLTIQLTHALQVYALPSIHNDPFDRLLIVQSQLEKMPLLTADLEIARYGVEIIW